MPNFTELANLVINELQRDNMIEYFTKCNEADGISTVLAYIKPAVKRFEKFSSMYRTNPDFEKHVNKMVLAIMQ